jgi:hypothetical protein
MDEAGNLASDIASEARACQFPRAARILALGGGSEKNE